MPTTWTPEVDARLFVVAMEVCGISISGPQYDEMAERMGEGFTSEALKHRFRKLKKDKGHVSNGPSRKAATPKAPKTACTPKNNDNSDDTKDNGEPKKSRSSTRKRLAVNYTDPETDDEKEPESPTKKIKHEDQNDLHDSASFFADNDVEQV